MMTAIRASWNIPEVCRKKGQETMQELIDDLSLSPLLKAMEANIHEAWIRLGHALGAVVHDETELLWFLSGLPFHLANGIVRTHFPLLQYSLFLIDAWKQPSVPFSRLFRFAQPQRDMRRLHRLLDHCHQLLAQRVQIHLVA